MAKVFRFHDGNDLYDWQSSNPLNDKAIAAIEDPNGEHSTREITSIPSPFARIDLVRTAFNIVEKSNLEGNTIHHKMVSDALDIGQILFNYEKFKSKIEIISWNPRNDLDALLNNGNPSHKLLGESLRLYFDQDSEAYNFDYNSKLYLINYKDGQHPINIIGGTSPASLFFTSSNTFNLNFGDGSDTFLDNDYFPLHKRDPEYIKYLFALKNTLPDFNTKFKQVDDYLTSIFSLLPLELRTSINNISPDFYKSLQNLNIDGGGEVVEILNTPLKKGKDKRDKIKESDFVINPENNRQEALLPLVLPNDIVSGKLLYVTDYWRTTDKVPHFNPNPINERVLPFDGNKFPYLTISDLLEPVIIKTEYPIDDFYFNKGNYEGDKSFLLPLKPLFFDYFTTESLDRLINGERIFELKALPAGSVEAILRIPIQNGNHITYKRIYYNPVNLSHKPDFSEVKNKGAVIENRINFAITPFYKFPLSISPEYNVAFYDADYIPLLENNIFQFNYFNSKNKIIEKVKSAQRRFNKEENVNMVANIVNENFKYIQLKHSFASGILVPKLDERIANGTSQFSFAIDFGTTNTHIEFSVDGGIPKPFEIAKNEPHHCGRLIDDVKFDEAYLKLSKDDVLPWEIAEGTEFEMPQRTAVSYHKKTDFNRPVFSMGNINIPFKYERYAFALNTEVKTNLKWNTENNSSVVLEGFFEQLIKMIRNKVLINNGAIEKTKIIWSYPASMSNFQLSILEEKWNKTISKYFNKSITIQKVCESLTPFYYYTHSQGVSSFKPVVSIDIGGGTSDVAVYQNEAPILFTSYRFAGDAIFGDNFRRNINLNGFVKKYFNKVQSILESNKEPRIKNILDGIKLRNNSNDLINALFSLENNKQLTDKHINISLLDKLKKDTELKIIFLLFYTAQIYHVAHLLKMKSIQIPQSFMFSGTASKLLGVVDSSTNHNNLQKIINLVFEHVYDTKEIPNINLKLPESPKELASKGGLYFNPKADVKLEEIKEVLLVTGVLHKSGQGITYDKVNELEEKALQTYTDFLEFFFEMNKRIPFRDTFGIEKDVLEYSRDFLNNKGEDALKMGIQTKIIELNEHTDEEIGESLFFYPLVGTLGSLAFELVTREK
ncbi:MAG: hypothetical protein ACJASR_000589 [Psychroserpens sp.]|jgi:hypothetical protein